MESSRTLEFMRYLVAGGLLGTAVAGAFFGGIDTTLLGFTLQEAGAFIGAAASAVLVKAVHLV